MAIDQRGPEERQRIGRSDQRQEADILQRHFRYRGPGLQRAAGQGQRQAAGKPKHEHGDDAGAGIYAEWRPDGLPLLLLRTMVRLKSINRKSTTPRSEEHTSELQSLMRISYAVFC